MKRHFIIFTALRYLKARRKSKGFASSLLSIFGVALGIITLTTVIAVMNGFQLTYINNLLEISSYHLQIVSQDGGELSDGEVSGIREIPGVEAVVPFREVQVMIDRVAGHSETMAGKLRAVDIAAALGDESFIRHLFGEKYAPGEFEAMKNDFTIGKKNSVIVGYLLTQYLGIEPESRIVISSVNDFIRQASNSPEIDVESRTFTVTNVFKSGYKDIDQYYLFISLENGAQFTAENAREQDFPLTYGVKLKNRFQDLVVKQRIEQLLPAGGFLVKTWRDFNKSYFGALLMEKMIMMLLVGLIFIVVGFNIFNSLRRIVYEKFEEIALLKAVGASPREIRAIFIFEGLLIGFLGGLIGLILGLFVAMNINGVFNFFTSVVNSIMSLAEQLAAGLGIVADFGRVESPFSPRVFYFREVPSVVIPEEAVFMFLFAVLSAAGAAFLASRKISEVKPSEVLRYE